jgi:HEAT repeat protein
MAAQREYTRSVRQRLESRTLDLESLRVNSADPATIALLEAACGEENARQAVYAISTLSGLPDYDIAPVVAKGLSHRSADVRAKCFELAAERGMTEAAAPAMAELRQSRGANAAAVPAAVCAINLAPEPAALASRLLTHPSAAVAETAVRRLLEDPSGGVVLTAEWMAKGAASPDPKTRRLAAIALRRGGDEPLLDRLLADEDSGVAEAAIESAGCLRRREAVPRLAGLLADVRLRPAATQALAAYGSAIAGALRDLIEDPGVPRAVRLRLPRVVAMAGDQRAAGELSRLTAASDPDLRHAVLAALARLLRESPGLRVEETAIDGQILAEVRSYYRTWTAMQALKSAGGGDGIRLLCGTLEDRLRHIFVRLPLLLGLRYDQRGVERAFAALSRPSAEERSAAAEFLETLLQRDLKRMVIPLLDDRTRLASAAKHLFGIDPMSPEAALRELMGSGDAWLVSCAVQGAAELRLAGLRPDVEALQGRSGHEVERVIGQVIPALA